MRHDEIVFLYKLARTGGRDLFQRRIEVRDETQQRTLVFLTVGTSPNALRIQVWTALIALLVLKYLQLRARFGFGWSLSNLAALLRQQLFVYRDLWEWIDQPFQPPPLLATAAEQIPLAWSGNLDRTPQPQPLNRDQQLPMPRFSTFPVPQLRLIWTAVSGPHS